MFCLFVCLRVLCLLYLRGYVETWFFFFSSRRRHTRCGRDWSSDVCSSDLHGARAVLSWDQATHMPPGGAAARGRQIALLSGLEHERMTNPAIGRLLDALTPWAETQPADSDAAAL